MWVPAAKSSMPRWWLISSPYLKVQDQLWSVAKRQEMFQDASGKSRKHSLEKVLTQIHNHKPFLFLLEQTVGTPKDVHPMSPWQPKSSLPETSQTINNQLTHYPIKWIQMGESEHLALFGSLWWCWHDWWIRIQAAHGVYMSGADKR